MEQKETSQEQEQTKPKRRRIRPWTPEAKAALRKRLPHKTLNAFGEWFFSEKGGKEYYVIVDEEAVLQ